MEFPSIKHQFRRRRTAAVSLAFCLATSAAQAFENETCVAVNPLAGAFSIDAIVPCAREMSAPFSFAGRNLESTVAEGVWVSRSSPKGIFPAVIAGTVLIFAPWSTLVAQQKLHGPARHSHRTHDALARWRPSIRQLTDGKPSSDGTAKALQQLAYPYWDHDPPKELQNALSSGKTFGALKDIIVKSPPFDAAAFSACVIAEQLPATAKDEIVKSLMDAIRHASNTDMLYALKVRLHDIDRRAGVIPQSRLLIDFPSRKVVLFAA